MFRRLLVSLEASNYDVGSIEQKLRQDGVIKEESSVNRSVLEETKRKYFGKRASKRSRDEEEIENMSRAADELHIGDQVAQGGGDGKVRGGDGGQKSQGDRNLKSEESVGLPGHPGAAGDAGEGPERKRRRISRQLRMSAFRDM